ncbi:hypothetical protein BKA67DRAFT_508664 [Truncatella angustata]|uniref:Carrier domain-containing protein n=1 Tax=Truncatella angustata TaxID=152316 RepID=A0A9P8UZ54_9PEZI|nr:uncharacterized protein BKA67DRAFT_508664 [Truncatella angustata]KAH6660833.1 hypothetical protein BKA67DRAFT_508664 [Truncatella angustata]
MDLKGLNYFTCTLGQSALWQQQQQSKGIKSAFTTVLEVVDEQAKDLPESPALGFADFSSKGQSHETPYVTFEQLSELSKSAACVLTKIVGSATATVGLISTSDLNFVLTWLGLMRLGHTVFLLAPQLETAALKHLCEGSGVKNILLGGSQQQKALQPIEGVSFEKIPDYNHGEVNINLATYLDVSTSDAAYLRHTSGTSTGMPKPIVQRHWGAVGVCPRLTGNEDKATFTTTPLYHGGLADCFRAWTAGAMIWFFPEGVVPVTETNIIKAIHYAHKQSPPNVAVAYFTSVPYVLQSLAGDREGLKLLQTMELVGVGGAALAASVGDELVGKGVRLVSRMGSAECGFLMSSHRDYDTDKEWQYLRPVVDERLLSFEPRDGGLFELVAKKGWPLRAKQNRQDGSYATSDLFQPHGHIPNAWRYHSRSDAQITLVNGKKFDPAPLESLIVASVKQLEDMFVFGTGKDFAGALLFPKDERLSDKKLLEAAWPVIEQANTNSQSHARLARSTLVVVSKKGGDPALEKSSKGTVMRRQAEERYADLIESVYNPSGDETLIQEHLKYDELQCIIIEKFAQVLDREINPAEDLFRQGVDSIACIQVRKLIAASLLPPGSGSLPLNVIYEQGTVENLSIYIQNLRQGGKEVATLSNGHVIDSDLKLMSNFARKHGNFSSVPVAPAKTTKQNHTVTLTGATGALGAHILHSLREDTSIQRVYCLIRAQTPVAAHERVSKGLWKRGLQGLQDLKSYPDFDNKIVCLPCNLFDKGLGLSDEDGKRISHESALVIHAAWTVNFSLQLGSFEDHLEGLHHLLQFALSSGSHFVFVSSTASVGASREERIPEEKSINSSDASPLGYSRSKWVAEQICAAAGERCNAMEHEMGYVARPKISIIRVGQLCGNAAGVWNASEAYPLMLSTAKITGSLPDLRDEGLNWLPVDQAATAVLEIASGVGRHAIKADGVSVYHTLNPHKQPRWHEMLDWLKTDEDHTPFEVVPPSAWLSRLEEAVDGQAAEHASQTLLGFWQRRYRAQPSDENEGTGDGMTRKPTFETSKTSGVSVSMAKIQPLSQDQVLRMWDWICNNVGFDTKE